MAPRLIAGNWKMNMMRADGRALAAAVAKGASAEGRSAVVLCPPATLIAEVVAAVAGSRVTVGGQDCHPAASGAHTGDIAAPMLADLGCTHVIVGHSERRQDHDEDNFAVERKARAALDAGLTPIICVGETDAERDGDATEAILSRQLAESIPKELQGAEIVVAYEPVWAIGTGRTATPEQVAAAHAHIRDRLARLVASPEAVPLLYGGSVKPANAAELLATLNVDGALVGGASLNAEDFLAIIAAAG
ncbi:MAG: triose-phosphate isomerase [Alphaproteobacteria bacterium]